jgi:sorbitol-specific phosphotransferase system component IIA
MKKLVLFAVMVVFAIGFANAQKVTSKVVDNKGTIKWVLDSSTAVITKGDSTLLFVTPHQMGDTLAKFVRYADTATMLNPYLNGAENGLTKNGQKVELGGALTKVTTIATTAANFLQITGLTSGTTTDSVMVVNPATGQVRIISTATLFNNLKVSNGLTKTGDSIQLGGNLVKATTIGATASNTLAITGLESGSKADSILVADATSGVLKRRATESLMQSGDVTITATAGQTSITVTNMPANVSKVWVFRNSAKLIANTDYTTSAGTVTLTPTSEWAVLAGDVFEVQWVK